MNLTTAGQLAVLSPAPKQVCLGTLGVGPSSHQIKKILGEKKEKEKKKKRKRNGMRES